MQLIKLIASLSHVAIITLSLGAAKPAFAWGPLVIVPKDMPSPQSEEIAAAVEAKYSLGAPQITEVSAPDLADVLQLHLITSGGRRDYTGKLCPSVSPSLGSALHQATEELLLERYPEMAAALLLGWQALHCSQDTIPAQMLAHYLFLEAALSIEGPPREAAHLGGASAAELVRSALLLNPSLTPSPSIYTDATLAVFKAEKEATSSTLTVTLSRAELKSNVLDLWLDGVLANGTAVITTPGFHLVQIRSSSGAVLLAKVVRISSDLPEMPSTLLGDLDLPATGAISERLMRLAVDDLPDPALLSSLRELMHERGIRATILIHPEEGEVEGPWNATVIWPGSVSAEEISPTPEETTPALRLGVRPGWIVTGASAGIALGSTAVFLVGDSWRSSNWSCSTAEPDCQVYYYGPRSYIFDRFKYGELQTPEPGEHVERYWPGGVDVLLGVGTAGLGVAISTATVTLVRKRFTHRLNTDASLQAAPGYVGMTFRW